MSAFVGNGELKVGDIMNVTVSLPTERLLLRAAVRRQSGKHFRFEFVDLSAEQVQQVKDASKKMQPFINKVMSAGRRAK